MSAEHSVFLDTVLADPPGDARHEFLRCRVLSVEALADELLRVHLTAPEFADMQLSGPDEFFGLVMPTAAESLDGLEARLVDGDRANLRATIAACDAAWRPELRWYTFRSLDQERAVATFDVATHGKRTGVTVDASTPTGVDENGQPFPAPGVNWVLDVEPGAECAIYTARGLWFHPSPHQLFVADPSALPSVWSILDYCERFHPDTLQSSRVVALAETDADIESPALARWQGKVSGLDVVKGPYAQHQELLREHIEKLALHDPGFRPEYVWASGEAALAKQARQLGIDVYGLDSGAIQWCVYWIAGKPRP